MLRDSVYDPVADIPVVQVIQAICMDGVSHTSGTVLCEVDPEAFLPYAFGKMDPTGAVGEGTLMHGQAARKTREGRGRWRQTE